MIDNILFFDTETTGLPPKNARWDEDFKEFPYLCEIAWIFGRKTESHIIRPDGWTIPEDASKIHGITQKYAEEHGERLADVLEQFVWDCHHAEFICGHNIYFDISVIKANIMRSYGREFYNAGDTEAALFKGKRIDTMRASMKWVDARFDSGRLKFPSLSELYGKCFPGETYQAHQALDDVRATARCLPVLVKEGLVELKVKEYPEQPELFPKSRGIGANLNESVPDGQDNVAAKIVKNIADSVKAVAESMETVKKAKDAAEDSLRKELLNDDEF